MANADRMPPVNLEAERSVIGCAMIDPAAADEVIPLLDAGDFYRDEHTLAWEGVRALRESGVPCDAVALGDWLERKGAAVAGNRLNDLLAELVDSVPHAANATYYAGIVRERAVARRLIEACEETLKACYAGLHTAPEMVAKAESAIFALGEREASGTTRDMDAVVGLAMGVIQDRQEGAPAGVMTGFPDLDDVLCGLRPGTLAILAARPSIGKTALGLAIASNAATAQGEPALFVSLEMDCEEIGERLLSAWSDVGGRALKQPRDRLGEGEWSRLIGAAGRLSGLPLKVDDAPARTVGQIAANARRIRRRRGLSMVVVDYLGLIDGERQRGESRQEEVARISRRLKAMAKELGVPVLALHQLNRQPESRDDRRPRLSDLRESGAIEQDAHVVMLLHRPEFYDPKDRPGMAEVIVAKNRSGAAGIGIEMAFRKEFTRFESVAGPATGAF